MCPYPEERLEAYPPCFQLCSSSLPKGSREEAGHLARKEGKIWYILVRAGIAAVLFRRIYWGKMTLHYHKNRGILDKAY